MKAVFKHLLKVAAFKRLDMVANVRGLLKLAVFTNKQPIARTRYRTVGGINRTIPNGSIRHV